jgi:hypothetical protein
LLLFQATELQAHATATTPQDTATHLIDQRRPVVRERPKHSQILANFWECPDLVDGVAVRINAAPIQSVEQFQQRPVGNAIANAAALPLERSAVTACIDPAERPSDATFQRGSCDHWQRFTRPSGAAHLAV